MTSLDDVIEQYKQLIEKKLTSVAGEKAKLDHLIELQKIKVKRIDGEKLSENDVHTVLNLLCWNDFAGCCAPEKDCPRNNVACEVLGIDYKELYEAKRSSAVVFLKNNVR